MNPQLLANLYRKIFDAALYHTHGNAEDALDITQDAFLGYYSVINRGGVVKHPLAYLRRAVLNHCINRYHRDRRQVEDPMDYQELEHRDQSHILLDSSLGPESILFLSWFEALAADLLGEPLS